MSLVVRLAGLWVPRMVVNLVVYLVAKLVTLKADAWAAMMAAS